MQRNSFSIRTIAIMACLFLIFVVANTATAAPPDNGSGPPFVLGQIVVAGGPDGLPAGYDIIKYLPNADLTVVRVESGREWGHIQSLRAKGFRANLNLIAKASEFPNDELYSCQWHFPKVQSVDAWTLANGSGVTVAVLDTGLATGGPDGIGCIEPGWDIVNSDNDPNDGDGHGTHVSGTISQSTNNGTGVAGLAHGACIMPVKVLDDSGSGTFADITEGIYYAVNKGAYVINMSLGTNARYNLRNDLFMDAALDDAYKNGVTVICASGNDGSRKNVSYPAIYPTTIAVGAVDYSMSVTRYSNKGFGLDLVAPGGDLTKDLDNDGYKDGVLQETRVNGDWGYWFFQGTSMASPHVAAVAAMLYSYNPGTTPDDVREALTSTALDIEDAGFDNVSGHGLVQAYDALGYGAECTDVDEDGWTTCQDDCNDTNPLVNPDAEEICDGTDNNCDGQIDEGVKNTYYFDADGDEFGDPNETQEACSPQSGYVTNNSDCDDSNPSVNPNATEICNDKKDNDCDGMTDCDDTEDCSAYSACTNSSCLPKGELCDSNDQCCSGKCAGIKCK